MDTDGTALFHRSMPYTERLGIKVLEHSPARVRSRLAWDGSLCTLGGALHGGVLMSVADANAGVCAYLNLPEGATGTATLESKTNFLRGVRDGHVEACSWILHSGRTVIVVETELTDDAGRLAGKVTQTQAVL